MEPRAAPAKAIPRACPSELRSGNQDFTRTLSGMHADLRTSCQNGACGRTGATYSRARFRGCSSWHGDRVTAGDRHPLPGRCIVSGIRLDQASATANESDFKQDELPSVLPGPKAQVCANRLNFGSRLGVSAADRHPLQPGNQESAVLNAREGKNYSWWVRTCPQLDQFERPELEGFLHRSLGEQGYESEGPSGRRRRGVFSFNGLSPEQVEQDLISLPTTGSRSTGSAQAAFLSTRTRNPLLP